MDETAVPPQHTNQQGLRPSPTHIQVNGKRPFPPTIKQPTMIDGRPSHYIQVSDKRPSPTTNQPARVTAVPHPTFKSTANGRSPHNKPTSQDDGRLPFHIQVNSKRPFLPTTNRPARITAVSHLTFKLTANGRFPHNKSTRKDYGRSPQ